MKISLICILIFFCQILYAQNDDERIVVTGTRIVLDDAAVSPIQLVDLNNERIILGNLRVDFDDFAYRIDKDFNAENITGLGGSTSCSGLNENAEAYGLSTDENFFTRLVNIDPLGNATILKGPGDFAVILTRGNNDIGDGVGYHFVGDLRKAFFTNEDMFVVLPDFQGESQAIAINNNRDIAGKVADEEGNWAPAMWKHNGDFTWDLGIIGGSEIVDGCANAIADNGDCVGFLSTTKGQPIPFYMDAVGDTLHMLPHFFEGGIGVALDFNIDRKIVGWSFNLDSQEPRASLWIPRFGSNGLKYKISDINNIISNPDEIQNEAIKINLDGVFATKNNDSGIFNALTPANRFYVKPNSDPDASLPGVSWAPWASVSDILNYMELNQPEVRRVGFRITPGLTFGIADMAISGFSVSWGTWNGEKGAAQQHNVPGEATFEGDWEIKAGIRWRFSRNGEFTTSFKDKLTNKGRLRFNNTVMIERELNNEDTIIFSRESNLIFGPKAKVNFLGGTINFQEGATVTFPSAYLEDYDPVRDDIDFDYTGNINGNFIQSFWAEITAEDDPLESKGVGDVTLCIEDEIGQPANLLAGGLRSFSRTFRLKKGSHIGDLISLNPSIDPDLVGNNFSDEGPFFFDSEDAYIAGAIIISSIPCVNDEGGQYFPVGEAGGPQPFIWMQKDDMEGLYMRVAKHQLESFEEVEIEEEDGLTLRHSLPTQHRVWITHIGSPAEITSRNNVQITGDVRLVGFGLEDVTEPELYRILQFDCDSNFIGEAGTYLPFDEEPPSIAAYTGIIDGVFNLSHTDVTIDDCAIFVLSKGEIVSSTEELEAIRSGFQINPNPLIDRSEITYSLPAEAFVDISVFNSLGQKVTQLVQSGKLAGTHSINWIPSTNGEMRSPGGVYIVRMELKFKYAQPVVLSRKALIFD